MHLFCRLSAVSLDLTIAVLETYAVMVPLTAVKAELTAALGDISCSSSRTTMHDRYPVPLMETQTTRFYRPISDLEVVHAD